MAMQSVANRSEEAPAIRGSNHDLWIGGKRVLTIALDRGTKGYPPHAEQCLELNNMIQGLALAAKAAVYQAENDTAGKSELATQSIESIADAITLLSQLSVAVQREIADVEAGRV